MVYRNDVCELLRKASWLATTTGLLLYKETWLPLPPSLHPDAHLPRYLGELVYKVHTSPYLQGLSHCWPPCIQVARC